MSSNTESSLKILLVDDDEIWVKTMKAILEHDGEFIVETALSGEEALEILKKVHPHIVLLDLNLGEDRMDGIQCCSRMRESGFEWYIFILTGDSTVERLVEGLKAGANDYLVKGQNSFLAREVKRLFNNMTQCRETGRQFDHLADGGYLRTRNLVDSQIIFLLKFTEQGFPRMKTFSGQTGMSQDVIGTRFFRIRKKLGLESMTQLTQMLTALESLDSKHPVV